MTEADLTAQLLTSTGMVFNITSVIFGIISAYIIWLYWFLNKSSVVLKLVAFLKLTLALAVLGIAIFGIMSHAEGLTLALRELDNLSILGRMAIEPTAEGVAKYITTGVSLLGVIVYAGLAYLTFGKRWIKGRETD